jgi:hypothetical protein
VSTTPAAQLARLKVTYQRWDIGRATDGTGFTAERRGLHSIYAPTLPELEAALAAAEVEAQQ